jgi:hypothetical protein
VLKALKVIMIIFGAILILKGLQNVIMPTMTVEILGLEEPPLYLYQIKTVIGASSIALGVWIIIAMRDLLRNIIWVKFAITRCVLGVAAYVYSIIQGYVSFSDCAMFLVVDAVFAVLFLALYPWGRTEEY